MAQQIVSRKNERMRMVGKDEEEEEEEEEKDWDAGDHGDSDAD